ncbi:hypothetical protein llap_9728 [Limosa lapponica baueri]|uniref:Uncharacterized protein n=1 Tax=Limosa lapponica baueri TaxID=1758121 RepID=A0A2I0U1L8_LIMLA|nr:hypothetical protein llap_9728 [Limosa lapponica baueri]
MQPSSSALLARCKQFVVRLGPFSSEEGGSTASPLLASSCGGLIHQIPEAEVDYSTLFGMAIKQHDNVARRSSAGPCKQRTDGYDPQMSMSSYDTDAFSFLSICFDQDKIYVGSSAVKTDS